MFTGIIENTGTLHSIENIEGDICLTISSNTLDFSDVNLGDSIASNGICLTVVGITDNRYQVDVSRETINKTALKNWQIGDTLNLEKAMLPTTRFGGHMVAGHVDGVGTIQVLKKDARSLYIEVKIPEELARYTATKGSITLDGISLTTNLVKQNIVCLNIIPHTAHCTNIARHWKVGSTINVEVDLVARYLERLCDPNLKKVVSRETSESSQGISEDFLAKNGFL